MGVFIIFRSSNVGKQRISIVNNTQMCLAMCSIATALYNKSKVNQFQEGGNNIEKAQTFVYM